MSDPNNITVPEKPLKKEGLISEELEGMDEVIFVDDETGSNFSLNTVAAAVLELCDGTHSCEDIARILSETLKADREVALKDTHHILIEFVAYGLIK